MYPFIETIRIEDGQIYNLDYHTERFNETRAAFWKDSTPLDLREFISPPTLNGIHKCRIVYGKEVEEVTYAPYQMRQVSSLHLVVSDTIDYTYKSAHREELNALYAQKGMADDILIVRNGYLTDTSIANVALYDGDTWFTPAHPLLRGTKRSEFLDRQLIVEKDIPQICLKPQVCHKQTLCKTARVRRGTMVLPSSACPPNDTPQRCLRCISYLPHPYFSD